MIKQSARAFFSMLGLTVKRKTSANEYTGNKETNPFSGYDYAQEGNLAVKLTKDNSMMPHINLFTLYEQAIYCERRQIRGAFVECGVWKGGAVGIMAKANLQYGSFRRHLHLFDAFDDICAPNAEIDGQRAVEDMSFYAGVIDKDKIKGQLEPVTGFYDKLGGFGTIDSCKILLENTIGYPGEFIHFHKGWFQDTLPMKHTEIDEIAILRLDGDWYESIKICLDYLFDKVVAGGLVVIDDYGYYDGCTKAVDEFLEKRNIKTFLSYSSVGCRYFVKN
jgi:O-methyltransferase